MSEFSGKVEKQPATKFASKVQVSEMIANAIPETKGKDVIPIYSGLATIPGEKEPLPTYDIYMRDENGMLKHMNQGRPFYMTKGELEKIVERDVEKERDAAVARQLEIKENQRYWENKKPNPITAGRAPQPTTK